MGERKPACHYIPSDFDPTKPARRCKPQNGQHQVRFMLPMSLQCKNCGDYMFIGTKVNCRKELCYNEFYLGINVYRIYMHCKSCYAEITLKTDPKNCDYIVEQGATRHFEPWRDFYISQAMEEKRKMLGTVMEKVEESTVDTQIEMEQLRELERLRAVSNKQDKVDLDAVKSRIEVDKKLTSDDDAKLDNFESEQKKLRLQMCLNRKEEIKPMIRKSSIFFNYGNVVD